MFCFYMFSHLITVFVSSFTFQALKFFLTLHGCSSFPNVKSNVFLKIFAGPTYMYTILSPAEIVTETLSYSPTFMLFTYVFV